MTDAQILECKIRNALLDIHFENQLTDDPEILAVLTADRGTLYDLEANTLTTKGAKVVAQILENLEKDLAYTSKQLKGISNQLMQMQTRIEKLYKSRKLYEAMQAKALQQLRRDSDQRGPHGP
jgi:uncharacterized coiled-coil protein SlyX